MRPIIDLLGKWRAAIASTGATSPGSREERSAERDERRARWAYEDESLRQHSDHGLAESSGRRSRRLGIRSHEIRRESREATHDRTGPGGVSGGGAFMETESQLEKRDADDAEIRRELNER